MDYYYKTHGKKKKAALPATTAKAKSKTKSVQPVPKQEAVLLDTLEAKEVKSKYMIFQTVGTGKKIITGLLKLLEAIGADVLTNLLGQVLKLPHGEGLTYNHVENNTTYIFSPKKQK